jgi:CheY-like chemotaxis protein
MLLNYETQRSSNIVAPVPGALPVLIVDDEPDILALLREVLEEAGFRVFTAPNGKAALALIAQTSVALVLTDLMMPAVTGLQLAQQLRSDPCTAAIPVLAMTAALPPHLPDLFATVISKPFELEELVRILRRFA